MCTRDESSSEEVIFALFGFKSNGVGMELLTNHNIWTPVSRFLFIRFMRIIIHVVDVWPSEREASEAAMMNMGKCITGTSLHWRHNEHNGISNHQPHGCLLNRLFRRRSKKTSKLGVTGLCVGNSPEYTHATFHGFNFKDVVRSEHLKMPKFLYLFLRAHVMSL